MDLKCICPARTLGSGLGSSRSFEELPPCIRSGYFKSPRSGQGIYEPRTPVVAKRVRRMVPGYIGRQSIYRNYLPKVQPSLLVMYHGSQLGSQTSRSRHAQSTTRCEKEHTAYDHIIGLPDASWTAITHIVSCICTSSPGSSGVSGAARPIKSHPRATPTSQVS